MTRKVKPSTENGEGLHNIIKRKEVKDGLKYKKELGKEGTRWGKLGISLEKTEANIK